MDQDQKSEFHEAEDRLMALGMYRYGYGFWELIRNDIRNDPQLSFNWVARSRTVTEIHKRCDQLIAIFKKELIPVESSPSKAKKQKAKVQATKKSTLGKRQRETSSESEFSESKPATTKGNNNSVKTINVHFVKESDGTLVRGRPKRELKK